MSQSVLSLKNATIYQDKNPVLTDVNIDVKHGEFLYLIGRTGSGKSSFLKHIISKIDLNNNYLYLPQEIEENQIEKLYEEIDFFEAIEKVLLVYEKALIVVSHDKTFIKNLNLEIWNINKKNNKDFFILKSM